MYYFQAISGWFKEVMKWILKLPTKLPFPERFWKKMHLQCWPHIAHTLFSAFLPYLIDLHLTLNLIDLHQNADWKGNPLKCPGHSFWTVSKLAQKRGLKKQQILHDFVKTLILGTRVIFLEIGVLHPDSHKVSVCCFRRHKLIFS